MTFSTGIPPNSPIKYLGPNASISTIVYREREPTGADYRQPETGKLYPLGCFWVVGKDPSTGSQGDFWVLTKIVSNVATWIRISSGSEGPGETITTDGVVTTGPIEPIDGNWNVLGQPFPSIFTDIPLVTTTGDSSTGTVYVEDRTYQTPYVVDNIAATRGKRGTYSTIQSAIDAAALNSSIGTVFIRPGTYLEDITLKSGINIIGLSDGGRTPNAVIAGQITHNTSGTVTITGVRLAGRDGAAGCLYVTGSVGSFVNLYNCYILVGSSTGIAMDTTSSTAMVRVLYCTGLSFSSGAPKRLFSCSGNGNLLFFATRFVIDNDFPGAPSTFSSTGTLRVEHSIIRDQIETTGTGRIAATHSNFNTSGYNAKALSIGADATSTTGENYLKMCNIFSGTATAMTITSKLNLFNTSISTSNVTPIDGAGELFYSCVDYQNSDFVKAGTTLTTTRGYLDGGHYVGDFSGVTIPAGCVGEYISSAVASGSAITLANNTNVDITSIVLTPGAWDVSGIVQFSSLTAGTSQAGSVSTASVTIGAYGDRTVSSTFTNTTVNDVGVSIPSVRILVPVGGGNKTMYLVAIATYTSGTCTGYGRISATRVA